MTPVGSVVVAVVAAVLIPLSALPAGAERHQSAVAASEVVGAARDRLAGAHDPAGLRPDTASEILTSVRDHSDVAAWIGAVAAVLEQRGGLTVAAAADGGSDEPTPGSVARAIPAGDLDGDGRGDVAVLNRDMATDTVTLQARRGGDAAVLWHDSAPAAGGLAAPLHDDVNGDGSDDLLRHTLTVVGDEATCPEGTCTSRQYNATFTWTVGVVSGHDGAPLWTRHFDGALEEITSRTGVAHEEGVTGEMSAETYTLRSTNLYVVTLPAELQGDQRPELLLQSVDLVLDEESRRATASSTLAVDVEDSAQEVHSSTRVDIVGADTGVLDKQLMEQTDGRIGLVYPVESTRGAAMDDLLWQQAHQPPSVSRCINVVGPKLPAVKECADDPERPETVLSLLSGRSFVLRWTVTYQGVGEAVPLDADVDADSFGDLYIGLEGGAWAFENRVLSGGDGRTLWSEPGHLVLLDAAPIDHEPGDDLIFGAAHEVDQGEAVELERRNGATGQQIFTTIHDFGWTGEGDFVYPFMYASALGDANGDGVSEVSAGVMRVIAMQQPDGSYVVTEIDSQAVAESGATGDVAHSVDTDEIAYLLTSADVDGDSSVDVLDERYALEESTQIAAMTAVRLIDGLSIWTDRAAGSLVQYVVGNDLDGDVGAEVLRHVHRADTSTSASIVSALRGRTGVPLWSVASTPGP